VILVLIFQILIFPFIKAFLAYRQIQPKLGLQHETVNHSVNFIDPGSGVHTQSIESYWTKTKYKFKVMKGAAADSLPSYLDERMWRDHWGATTKDAFESICKSYKKKLNLCYVSK
jgi:hypothetical protein